MADFIPEQEHSIAAFIVALSEQDEALPPTLQAQLQAIGQNLDHRVMELITIAASLPRLNKSYQEALTQMTRGDDKSTGQPAVTFVSSSETQHSLSEHAVQILTATDPVSAAKQELSHGAGSLRASNPFQRLFRRG